MDCSWHLLLQICALVVTVHVSIDTAVLVREVMDGRKEDIIEAVRMREAGFFDRGERGRNCRKGLSGA